MNDESSNEYPTPITIPRVPTTEDLRTQKLLEICEEQRIEFVKHVGQASYDVIVYMVEIRDIVSEDTLAEMLDISEILELAAA